MKITLYQYPKCSTCKKAIKWLDQHQINYTSVNIVDKPPGISELKRMLGYYNGNVKRLFNTSGLQYRELDMKTRLPELTTNQAIKLLSSNGMLVKRPFVLTEKAGLVGFHEPEWGGLLG